ncbi:MAG TPA: lipoprotein signal peptidase [Sphingobacterium sp.]|nr:lipoprotein signal peptidase [Sphingobacterium sp.]
MKVFTKSLILIISVLTIDQLSKFWVKLNMTLGQDFKVLGDKFLIHFIENNGMAYGLEFGGETGKLFLSIFRIIAVMGIGYGIYYMIKHKYNQGFILTVSLIFAGALGNIIDSAFYGVMFSESTYYDTAVLFPEGGGYSSLFHGKVVDMLYFPLIKGAFPSWFPLWGGQDFLFFRPVFNVADSAITIGVFLILIFQKKYFKEDTLKKTEIDSQA